MSRKSKQKILFGLKVLAICGAAVFMIKGVGSVCTDGSGNNKKEEANRTVQESVFSASDAAAVAEPAERKITECVGEGNSTNSMDWNSEDAYLLAKIAMAEAEGEGLEGKALVILVVLNRVQSDEFPNSISEVIFQKGQFSPVSNGRYNRVEPDKECYEALELIQFEKWDESQGALYFESASESDWHRKNLKILFQHGRHYFYADKGLVE